MTPICYVLPLGHGLYLDALGASLRDLPDIKVLPPGSTIPPDIVLVAYVGDALDESLDRSLDISLEVLRRYPHAAVLAVNVTTHRLTALAATFGQAQTPDDLLKAIQRLANQQFDAAPHSNPPPERTANQDIRTEN